MEIRYLPIKELSLAHQAAHLKSRHDSFQVKLFPSYMEVKGRLRPTARSIEYTFELCYWQNYNPSIRIVMPQLKRNEKNEPIPHMYTQTTLCLFKPQYREFKRTDFISDTIIPWISLWLYHYENWHVTGDWDGGGEHPNF